MTSKLSRSHLSVSNSSISLINASRQGWMTAWGSAVASSAAVVKGRMSLRSIWGGVRIEKEVMEHDSGNDKCVCSGLIAAAAEAFTERAEGGEAALEYTKCLLHLDTHGRSLHVELSSSTAENTLSGWFGEHRDA